MQRDSGPDVAECRQMKILVLPDALEEIGVEAFYKCEELTQVILPDTLRKIGKRGFYQCGLEELHLPEHLEYIGESAFFKNVRNWSMSVYRKASE